MKDFRPPMPGYSEAPDDAGQQSRADSVIFINGYKIECFDDYDFFDPKPGKNTTSVKIDDRSFDGTYAEAVKLCMTSKQGNRSPINDF